MGRNVESIEHTVARPKCELARDNWGRCQEGSLLGLCEGEEVGREKGRTLEGS